jgi:short-subunit dehydrogenase
LAKIAAQQGFDLIVAADKPQIKSAAVEFRSLGANVTAVEADLATLEGFDQLCSVVGDRAIDTLLANAERGLGKGFLDQDFNAARRVIDTNIGARGIGEIGLAGVAAAITAAMHHATGVRVRELPVKIENLLS